MDLVRALREQKGWSQEHLARVSGVAKRTIQRVETGSVEPSAETAMALAQHLEVTPEAILNWSGIRHHLRTCVSAWHDRAPTTEDLARVPARLRPLFSAYHRGMASMKSCEDLFTRTSAEAGRVHEQIMAMMDENSVDLRAFRDAGGPAAALEALARIGARRTAIDCAHARHVDLLDQMRRTTEHLMQVSRDTAGVASRLDRELDAYDVFAVYTSPTAAQASA
jgi:transcriptional regulator with XRE-family HTH domain